MKLATFKPKKKQNAAQMSSLVVRKNQPNEKLKHEKSVSFPVRGVSESIPKASV